MGQDSEPRIPVLEMIDAKFHAGRLDGFRYHDMPADPETWRRLPRTSTPPLASEAARTGSPPRPQSSSTRSCSAFSEGELDWELPVEKAWGVVMRGVLGAFYSHPWAWNEIGFGGPAYPRGFARLGAGQREHWETPPEFAVDPVPDVQERGLE